MRMEQYLAVLTALAAISLVVTKVIDFIRSAFDKEKKVPTWVWNLLALLIGVAYCVLWQIDLSKAMLSLVPALADVVLGGIWGQIITGLTIGALAGFFHDAISTLQAKKELRKSQAEG